jgi:dienelactone hydrolase
MGGTPDEYTVIAKDLASFGFIVAGTSEERVPLDLERRAEMQPVVDRWASDAIQLLDRVPNVDKNRVGVFGHSFGGAVAIHLLQSEPRFKRGANLDGAPQGSTVENLTRPILFLNGAPLPPSQQALNDRILAEMKAVCNSNSAGCEWKDYPEAGHMNFSDKAARTLEGTRFLHQVSDDLLRFFSRL